jgi:hypothetical protein
LWDLSVRFRFASVNHVWKLHRVLDEKDRNVVSDNVPVALLSVELDGETPDITDSVCGTTATEHGGES